MIQVLLFDFYGVFATDAYNDWLTRNNLKREGVFARLIDDRDRGNIHEVDFLHRLSLATGHAVTHEDVHRQSVANLNDELVATLRQIKSQYRIGLLSNASVNLRTKLSDLGIADLFDEIIISSEIGHAKPSVDAFTAAFARFEDVDRTDILFIDDNPANVQAAATCGATSITYTTNASLFKAMKQAGIQI